MTASTRNRVRPGHARPLLRLLRMLWRHAPRQVSLYALFSVLRGILPLAQLLLFRWIVDAIVASLASPDPASQLPRVMLYVAGAGITYWLLNLSTTADAWLRQHLMQQFTDNLHDLIHEKSITVGLAYYENSEFRDSLHRAQREALTRPARMIQETGSLFQNVISLSGVAVLLLTVHWLLGVALVLASLPDIALRLHFSRRWYDWERNRTQEERQARYLSWVLTSTYYAKDLLLFGLGKLFSGRFREQRAKLRREKLDLLAIQSRLELIAKTVSALVIFGLYVFIAWKTVLGAISIGSLVLVIQGLARGGSMLQRVLTGIAAMYETNLFLTNLFDFLDREPQLRSPASPAAVPSHVNKGLRVESVSFRYPNREDWALQDVTFELKSAQVLAIIGSNGSGKTTLVKLLTRLYDPTVGRITLDGVDLREFDPDELRRLYSVVFQDFARFQSTLRENITLGDSEGVLSQDTVDRAAEASGVTEFLPLLPRGYDTLLGTWFDDSVDLSEGQWQRLALARALVRPSRFVIFDEPSSSLDVRSEHHLVSRLRMVLAERAAILISHRRSTVLAAGQVLVLDRGRIVDTGTSSELLAPGKRHADLLDSFSSRD